MCSRNLGLSLHVRTDPGTCASLCADRGQDRVRMLEDMWIGREDFTLTYRGAAGPVSALSSTGVFLHASKK